MKEYNKPFIKEEVIELEDIIAASGFGALNDTYTSDDDSENL